MYQLITVNERKISTKIFDSAGEAYKEMKKSFLKASGISKEELKELQQNGLYQDYDFGISEVSAYASDTSSGNWDWKITPISFNSDSGTKGEKKEEWFIVSCSTVASSCSITDSSTTLDVEKVIGTKKEAWERLQTNILTLMHNTGRKCTRKVDFYEYYGEAYIETSYEKKIFRIVKGSDILFTTNGQADWCSEENKKTLYSLIQNINDEYVVTDLLFDAMEEFAKEEH